MIDWLSRMGFEREIAADRATFHIVELGAAARSEVDSFELLMAVRPKGVICYSSAIAYHSLSNQTAQHHHIGELQAPIARESRDIDITAVEAGPRVRSVSPPRLGTELFRYGGIPYFASRRSSRLVPGVQIRDYGPRTRIRITTLEQTLLDALAKPFHVGGPEVVFEAWHVAMDSGQIDEGRMAGHLDEMQYPATDRRVGAMLEILGHSPGRELRYRLDQAQSTVDPNGPFARISLLPGIDYQQMNENWLVWIP